MITLPINQFIINQVIINRLIINQCTIELIDQLINQSSNELVDDIIYRLIDNQSINKWYHRPINQLIDWQKHIHFIPSQVYYPSLFFDPFLTTLLTLFLHYTFTPSSNKPPLTSYMSHLDLGPIHQLLTRCFCFIF